MAGLDLSQGIWFLPVALPIALYVAWSDLARMKIPNLAVYALVVAFAVLGLLALPLEGYLWRWTHLVVVLLVGMLLNAGGAIGAGDAKFAAAAAPFVALGDTALVFYLLAGCLLASFVAHRLVRATALRRLAPDWESWKTGKRFPMGLPLAATLVIYLAQPFWA